MKPRSVFVLGIASGVAMGTLLANLLTGGFATAQIAPLTPQPQQPAQPRILLDERRQELVYANGFRLFQASEEVVADMGFNMPNPGRTTAAQPDALFDVRMRLVMSYATAKRFNESLDTIIKDYETRNGPIKSNAGPATTPSAR